MVKVIGPKDKRDLQAINTTSSSNNWSRGLSPFFLGPVSLYEEITSKNLENAWQYSKVYPGFVDEEGEPTEKYWRWAMQGWAKGFADRYPMGKGKVPLFCFFDNKKLDYISARKKVYLPLYQKAVKETESFKKLKELYKQKGAVTLFDFDGYDYLSRGMSLKDVLNDPTEKMGHAFILAMMLTYGEDFKITDL